MSAVTPVSALRALRRIHGRYGRHSARRRALLRVLERRRLAGAAQVRELHEQLCFLHAYPDDEAVFTLVERMLVAFDRRSDLRRHRAALTDSGIAGTDIYYRFLAPTARWLAARWGAHLRVDWDEVDSDRVARHLTLAATFAECPGQDEPPLEGLAWLHRLRGGDGEAPFLVRRFASLAAAEVVRDHFYDELRLMLRLVPGSDTPRRTGVRFSGVPLVVCTAPLRRWRPNLKTEAENGPRTVRNVGPREASRLIDLAREAMVSRSRDLDAFAHASPQDVRLADCGDGLQFACIGVVPEWRLVLEAVYGFLILQNGVPIGYALASALFESSEIAFNIFDTFRGGEAAIAHGRLIGLVRAMFGSDTFTIFPYQLGHENDEGIESGAWWFYYKLGYRPRDPETKRLVRRELARLQRRPSYRSSAATLGKLARHNVFLDLGRRRDDVIGDLPTDRIGLAVTDYLNARFGADRERGTVVCADEVARLLGAGNWRRFPPGEREAWRRLAPLVRLFPGLARWNADDRQALAAIVRAKGGRRESDFVALADRHARFRWALVRLARRPLGS